MDPKVPVTQLLSLGGQVPAPILLETVKNMLGRLPAPGSHDQNLVGAIAVPPVSLSHLGVFSAVNAYHQASLDACASLTSGFGFFEDSQKKILDALSPVCGNEDWQETLDSAVHNMYEFGAGYIEIVRDDPIDSRSKIIGIHFHAANTVWRTEPPSVNGKIYNTLAGYRVAPPSPSDVFDVPGSFGEQMASTYVMPGTFQDAFIAPFGLAAEFIQAHNIVRVDRVSEMIDLRQVRTRASLYPIPGWISVIGNMQLMTMGMQHESEYFWNRGLPLWFLIATGARVKPEDWDKIQTSLNQHVGPGNGFKGQMFNFDDPNIKVDLKLLETNETTRSRYLDNADTIANHILTAHRVPPRIAAIQTSGRIGAVNEAITDLWLFQRARLEPVQRRICRILADTLGDPEMNGGLGLTQEDFLGAAKRKGNNFETVMEDQNVMALQGLGRMKDPAVASDRDPADGPLRNGQERNR